MVPTILEFIKENPDYNTAELMSEYTKLQVKAALEAASNSRCINMYNKLWFAQSIEPETTFFERVNITINKQAIIDSYHLNNII